MANTPPVWPPAPLPGGAVPPGGPNVADDVDVAINSDGRAEAFFVCNSGGRHEEGPVYFMWQTAPGASHWNMTYYRLGSAISSQGTVRVVSCPDGRLETFLFSQRGIVHCWQQNPHAGPWTEWQQLIPGSKFFAPIVANDGRVHLFWTEGTAVCTISQQNIGNRAVWTTKAVVANYSSQLNSICASKTPDGRFALFFLGADLKVLTVWQEGGNWHSTPVHLNGGLARDICVATNPDGRLELFVIGAGNMLHHMWQTAPNGGWSNWEQLPGAGPYCCDIQAIRGANDRIVVFTVNQTKGAVEFWYQDQPGRGPWHNGGLAVGGQSLPRPVQKFRAFRNQDGSVEVIALNGMNYAWHAWQTGAPNTPWNGYRLLWPMSGAPPG